MCTKCGFSADDARFCPKCGNSLVESNSVQNAPNETSPKPGSAPHRPPTPPLPPPPASRGEVFQSRPPRKPPSMETAERISATGKVVGLSGCLLALFFWVIIPLGFLLVATALSSSTGFAIVALALGLILAFAWWVWQRTGN